MVSNSLRLGTPEMQFRNWKPSVLWKLSQITNFHYFYKKILLTSRSFYIFSLSYKNKNISALNKFPDVTDKYWHLNPLRVSESPGWCGSVDWVTAWEPKGCWFNSQSGHMPRLQARSPVGNAQEATTQWCFSPSSSPSLPLSLKINK